MGSSVKSISNAAKGVIKNPTSLSAHGEFLARTSTGGLVGMPSGINNPLGSVDAGAAYNFNAQPFQATDAQKALTEQLRLQSLGQGPSIANQQLKAGTDRAVAQQIAAAAGNRGNAALAQREAMRNQAAIGQQAAGDAAQLRSQEMLTAQNTYRDELGAQQKNLQDLEALRGGQYQAREDRKFQAGTATQAQTGKLLGGVLGAGADIFSDKGMKKNIKKVDLSEILDSIEAYKFDYKDASKPGTAEGKQVGIMAQDLEKSKLGKEMVKNTPDGKMVDTSRMAPVALAAVAQIAKQIKEMKQSKTDKNNKE